MKRNKSPKSAAELRRAVGIAAALVLSLTACAIAAPSLYDFHDRILRPLAAQKADDLAEQNRLHVRKAFEKAEQAPNGRWVEYFYWGLDALGVAGYGMPGQGRLLEKFKGYYQGSSTKNRDAILRAVLLQIDEERIADRQLMLKTLIDHTSQELAVFGTVYAVCDEGVARRYRAQGDTFSRLEDKSC
jgi:hypothetical protein